MATTSQHSQDMDLLTNNNAKHFPPEADTTLDFSKFEVRGLSETLSYDSIFGHEMPSDFTSLATTMPTTLSEDVFHSSCFSQIETDFASSNCFKSNRNAHSLDQIEWCAELDEGIDFLPMPLSEQTPFQGRSASSLTYTTTPCLDSKLPVFNTDAPDHGSAVTQHEFPDRTERPTPSSPLPFSTDDQRWQATQSRSRAADRFFLYGVSTTKIFCRPSCASRRPSRRHVRFFTFPGAIEAAQSAKFRPCKRCIPNALGVKNPGVLGICEVLRLIIAETFGAPTTEGRERMKLESLAKSAGLSTFHFHRTFKATTLVTPGDFIHACRALALQDALGKDEDDAFSGDADAVALIEASPCWSIRSARKALGGISPIEFAKGSATINVQYCSVDTPAGTLCLAYSPGKSNEEIKVHTVLLGIDAEARVCVRFPATTASSRYAVYFMKCVHEVKQESQDRDTELTAEVLVMLWRVRMWLSVVQHCGD